MSNMSISGGTVPSCGSEEITALKRVENGSISKCDECGKIFQTKTIKGIKEGTGDDD